VPSGTPPAVDLERARAAASGQIPGKHGNGALLAQVVLTRAVNFADDFAG
jgi:hypothetical protein